MMSINGWTHSHFRLPWRAGRGARTWLALVLGMAATVRADLRLNGLFTDNMVLQRDRPIPVWGSAAPGVAVTIEFAGQQRTVVATADGSWSVELDALSSATQPRELTVSPGAEGESACITNVVVGDVWLCGGQSNMAQTMDRYLAWESIRDGFANPQLRLFKIRQGGMGSPEPTNALVIDPFFRESWQACTPEFAAQFSATAGFFGMKLQRDTGVPVGLIYANRGGTQANMWIPRDVLEANPAYARFLDESNANRQASRNNPGAIRAPSRLYNGTIYPLVPFAIRGAIWYQGESDSQWPEVYAQLFGDVVDSWRRLWGYDFPFFFVQLAPYQQVDWDQTGEAWAWLREAQTRCLDTVSNTGMVVITDAGEARDIHPQAKRVVGERLAVLAASLDDRRVDAAFPTFRKMKVREGKAILRFRDVSGGLATRRVALNTERGHLPGQGPQARVAEELEGFTLCGPDRVFVKARAEILSRNTVVVHSDEVRDPVAVRYGWSNFPLCNLYGGNGMPTTPFRTDEWSMPNLTGEHTGEPFAGVTLAWGTPMDEVTVPDGGFQVVEMDGITAWQADGRYLYFKAAGVDQPASARVHMIYRDEGYGTIQMRYDSTSSERFDGDQPGVWKPAGKVRCENSFRWRVAGFELPDAGWTGRCNGGDLRLQSTGPLTIGGIYIQPEGEP